MIQQTLVRDENSQAVINTDLAALNKYKQERALYRKVEILSKELVSVKQTLARVCERLDQIENQ